MDKENNQNFIGMDEPLVDQLLKEYGSPLLVFKEATIREKYRILREALDMLYPKSEIAYSVKTNYVPGLVRLLKECGALAEVVSGFEYWLAKKLSFAPREIIFNGPVKNARDVETALLDGVRLNIDNFGEIPLLASKVLRGRKIGVGIRINTDLLPLSNRRFGFNAESGEFLRAIELIKAAHPDCSIIGLHSHIGVLFGRPELFGKIAERVTDCGLMIEEKYGEHIEYLDLGGGFPICGARTAVGSFWDVPDIRSYMEHITSVLNSKFHSNKPLLIIEPGRYLIDEAGVFLATVTDTKFVGSGKTKGSIISKLRRRLLEEGPEDNAHSVQFITIDSSSESILRTPSDAEHISVIQKQGKGINQKYATYIAGNSCITRDYLTRKITLSQLTKGDIVLFSNAGAYTLSRSEQFIHPRPATVLLKKSGEIECILRSEKFEDMIIRSQ